MQQIERHKTLKNYAKGYICYPANHFNSTIESLCEQNLNNEHLKVESITQLSIEEHKRRDSTFYSPPVAVLPELAKAFAWNPGLTKKTEKDLEWVGGTALDVFAHL